MSDVRVGQQGHVSFLLLAPKFDHKALTESRDAAGNIQYRDGIADHGPILVECDVMTAETFPTGETACQMATVTSVNADGTVNATGYNAVGEQRRWRDVRPGDEPNAFPVDADGFGGDPAGHVFHTTCPYGR